MKTVLTGSEEVFNFGQLTVAFAEVEEAVH